MQDQPNQVRTVAERKVQRGVVLQLLRCDHDARWPRAELEREFDDVEPLALSAALAALASEGVLLQRDETLSASRAARRLDELELIAI
jgi:hypothetical protein